MRTTVKRAWRPFLSNNATRDGAYKTDIQPAKNQCQTNIPSLDCVHFKLGTTLNDSSIAQHPNPNSTLLNMFNT